MTFHQPRAPVYADETTKSLVVNAYDPFELRDIFPKSRTLDHPDWNVAVEWTDDTAQILRNMGFNAPFRPRNWPGIFQPKDHQLEMITFLLSHVRCFNLSEMGTMKTAPSVWAADVLMKRGIIQKALVICPLSTMRGIWRQAIFDTAMHRTCSIVHGTEEQRRKALSANVDFYVINHDATRIAWLQDELKRRKDIGLVVVDEGGEYRNGKSDKFDGLKAIIRKRHRVWWMTGTPCPNFPTDAYSQCEVINPDAVPSHFGTFKRMTMYQESRFKWKKAKGAEQIVFNAMQPAIRFLKKDVKLNLPPCAMIPYDAPLSREQLERYAEMKKGMTTTIGTVEITAVHAADQIGKLRQILCGVVKDPENPNSYLPLDFTPRLKVLRGIIEGSSSKVVVIVPFKGILKALAAALEKTPPGGKPITVGILNGDVPFRRREEIIHAFKNNEDPTTLLCHPKVMSHGLNLTEADITAFFAPIYSNDQFEQVIERFNRMGQIHAMTVARIAAHPLERAIYRLIDERRLSQKTILDLYHRVLAGQPLT